MSDDINEITAKMRKAANDSLHSGPMSGGAVFVGAEELLDILDDWERRGRREREAVDFAARAAALDRRRIVDMLDLKEGRQTALDALAALTARMALDPVLSMDERALIGLVMRLTGGGANPHTVSAQIARIRGEAKGKG